MEDKTFALLEKLYGEFREFKDNVNQRFDGIDQRFEGIDQRFEGIDQRLNKMEIALEEQNDKISEAFEAFSAYAEINEKQHQEILRELRGRLDTVELAVKRIAK